MALGVISLAWHGYKGWDQLRYVLDAAQVLGGAAIQFPRTAKVGAAALGVAYLIFALLGVPPIVAAPQVYNNWGNFFEQFSLANGAAIVYARFSSSWPSETIKRVGGILFGLCSASFALEQAFYLCNTASLVPKWLPPSQTFWALATTVFFALAAVALLMNRLALVATRLLALMIVGFGLVVWIPLILSDPRSQENWSEAAETFAIAGVAWILADLLGESRSGRRGEAEPTA